MSVFLSVLHCYKALSFAHLQIETYSSLKMHLCQLLETRLHKAMLLHWCRLVKYLHLEICINAAFGKSVYEVLLKISNWYRRRLQLVNWSFYHSCAFEQYQVSCYSWWILAHNTNKQQKTTKYLGADILGTPTSHLCTAQ